VADHEAVAAAAEAPVSDECTLLAQPCTHDGAGGRQHLRHAGATLGALVPAGRRRTATQCTHAVNGVLCPGTVHGGASHAMVDCKQVTLGDATWARQHCQLGSHTDGVALALACACPLSQTGLWLSLT
jgi:hypothetical protein